MKKINVIIIILMFSMAISCKKNLLDTIPDDRLSTTMFWKTENDAVQSVNSIYPFLNSTEIFTWDKYTDIGHNNEVFTNDANIEQGIYDASNTQMKTTWNNAYTGIEKSNFFLANADKIKTDNTTLINRLKGEARVLRAYQYILLAAFFGDIPLVTEPISIEEGKNLTRTPVSAIWDFIDIELSESSADLPLTYTGQDLGRITKGAALALKARADLYAGRYQSAAGAAKSLMDLNVYSLYPEYATMFSYKAENNSGVILDKQSISNVSSTNVFQLLAPNSQKNSLNNLLPTKKLVDMFEMKNGKDINDAISGFDPFNPYANRDPRLQYSIFLPGDLLPDGKIFDPTPGSETQDEVSSTFHATATGFTVKKYVNKEDYALPTNSGINIILIRYAEELLTYAEAKIELNQIDQSVYDAINEVRQRADVGMPEIIGPKSQDEMREIVRRERNVEFAFEGLHFFDIRRWKTAENIVPGPVYGITYVSNGQLDTIMVSAFNKQFNPQRDYLWPIPSDERLLATGLTQNPGW